MANTDTTDLRNKLAVQTQRSAAVEQQGPPTTIADLINRQRSEIARALPKHMDPDRLARIATTTIKTTPALLECSASSLLGALMLSAQTGLEPGPLGHVYFVPRKNKGVTECQWMLGYKGIIELARRSGQITSIEAREVCERDHFEFAYGLDERLVHEPYMLGERGPIVAFWGLAKFKDGGHYFLVMSKADVDKAKERSDAGKKGFGPWISDYAAMGRKTVIRRMMPFLPLSSEQANAITQDETVHNRITANMAEDAPAQWVDAYVDAPATIAAVPDVDADVVADEDRSVGASTREDEDGAADRGADAAMSDAVATPAELEAQLAEQVAIAKGDKSTPARTPSGEVEMMTEPQSKALHALLRKNYEAAGPGRFPILSDLLGREITSTKEITKDEASRLIDAMQENGAPDGGAAA